MRVRHVGISLGQIDSLSDGLGEFSTQVCARIVALAPQWRRDFNVRFHLHMPRAWHGRFGDGVDYLSTCKSQGYLHWQGFRRFDVWHGLNQLGRIAPPWGARHSLLTIHDLNTLYHDSAPVIRKSMRKLSSRLRHFDEVTTLTHHVEGDIRRHLGWDGPVSVIANGARDLTLHPREPVAGLAPGSFLLHLSRMAPSKNPQCLLDLAACWPAQAIVLAGPRNTDSNRLQAQAAARQLHNLTVLQEVSDARKAWLYANCQGFVFPSLTEGFGLPPLEAMHFGKPVYLSRLTSLPEIGGARAAYFDSFEPGAMRRLIEAEQPRLQAESPAIQAHAAQFTWDRSVESYLAIYRRMLDRDRVMTPAF